MSKRHNPWIKVGWDAAALGTEAAAVINLRLMKMAVGGPAASREAELMVSEKVQALWELQSMAMVGALGFSAPRAASKSIAHYRKRVSANRRRLVKSFR